jgi:hypothetical protein
VEVGGIEIDVGIARLLEWPVQEGLHLLVDVLADAALLGLGDAALHTQRLHQGIDLAGRDPADLGLNHHPIQGLVDAAAWLKDRGKDAPLRSLGISRSMSPAWVARLRGR